MSEEFLPAIAKEIAERFGYDRIIIIASELGKKAAIVTHGFDQSNPSAVQMMKGAAVLEMQQHAKQGTGQCPK